MFIMRQIKGKGFVHDKGGSHQSAAVEGEGKPEHFQAVGPIEPAHEAAFRLFLQTLDLVHVGELQDFFRVFSNVRTLASVGKDEELGNRVSREAPYLRLVIGGLQAVVLQHGVKVVGTNDENFLLTPKLAEDTWEKWVIFQRGEYIKPMAFDGWFFKGGSTWNRWLLVGDFSKGGVHKTDRLWWVLECFFIASNNWASGAWTVWQLCFHACLFPPQHYAIVQYQTEIAGFRVADQLPITFRQHLHSMVR